MNFMSLTNSCTMMCVMHSLFAAFLEKTITIHIIRDSTSILAYFVTVVNVIVIHFVSAN